MRHVLSTVLALSLLASITARAQSTAASVDVPMIDRGPQPAVAVMVNGKGPFTFAIDTGASGMGRADASLVTTLHLKDVGAARGGDGTGSPVRTMSMVGVDALTIGSLTRTQLALPSRDYNTAPNVPRIDGILGFGFFADALLTLDFPGHRVRIGPGELPPANGADILDFDAERGIPVVTLLVALPEGEARLPTVLDTGNIAAPLLVPESLAGKLTFKAPPTVVGKARTLTTEIEIKQGAANEGIRIGRHALGATVTFPSIGDTGTLGPAALKDCVLTFDQKNKRLRITGPGFPAPASASRR